MALLPSRVRIVAQTSRTEWNQCRAPCPPKLNRTAVGLTRPSTPLIASPCGQEAHSAQMSGWVYIMTNRRNGIL
jgi:hypothetical protein